MILEAGDCERAGLRAEPSAAADSCWSVPRLAERIAADEPEEAVIASASAGTTTGSPMRCMARNVSALFSMTGIVALITSSLVWASNPTDRAKSHEWPRGSHVVKATMSSIDDSPNQKLPTWLNASGWSRASSTPSRAVFHKPTGSLPASGVSGKATSPVRAICAMESTTPAAWATTSRAHQPSHGDWASHRSAGTRCTTASKP